MSSIKPEEGERGVTMMPRLSAHITETRDPAANVSTTPNAKRPSSRPATRTVSGKPMIATS